MTRPGVKPSPPNFEIWYRHATGRYPELSRTLEVLERSGGSFDDARNAQLHERLFGVGRGARRIAGIGRRIERLRVELDEAGAAVSRFGATLPGVGARVAKEVGGTGGHPLVAAIVGEATRITDHTRRLDGRLAEAARAIVDLHDDLAAARADTGVAELAGVARLKGFDLRHDEDVADRPATGEPLSLLLVDVDRFEAFNDAHGRPLGDRVLTLMARALTRSIKGRGLVTSYAGDQFATPVPRTALADAATLANQLRRLIAANRIVIKGTGRDLGAITLSIGVAEHKLREPLGHLLRRAGAALQLAKRAGGNRVNVADCSVAGAAAGEPVRPAIAPAAAPA